jgi:hypothetical protein
MNGDAIGAKALAIDGNLLNIRCVSTTCVAQGGYLVNVYAEINHSVSNYWHCGYKLQGAKVAIIFHIAVIRNVNFGKKSIISASMPSAILGIVGAGGVVVEVPL